MSHKQPELQSLSSTRRKDKNANTYRILIADDHVVARHGLKASLVSLPGAKVCGEARTGREAVQLAKKMKPDLVILDLSLPEINGVEVARRIRSTLPRTEVLVVTFHVSEDVARLALRAGARGYVAKSDPHEELITAVQKVRRRKLHLTKKLGARLRGEIKRIQPHRPDDQAPLPDSTLTPEQIASILVRSEMKIHDEAQAMLRSSNSDSNK